MSNTVFLSWQADRSTKVRRRLWSSTAVLQVFACRVNCALEGVANRAEQNLYEWQEDSARAAKAMQQKV